MSSVHKVKGFLKSEGGPTATEYAVMLALNIVVCIATITSLGQSPDAKFGEVRTALQ
jgi:pilus assembly protein Flp/PilA